MLYQLNLLHSAYLVISDNPYVYRVIEFKFKSQKGYERIRHVLFSTLFVYMKYTQNHLHKAMFLQDSTWKTTYMNTKAYN